MISGVETEGKENAPARMGMGMRDSIELNRFGS